MKLGAIFPTTEIGSDPVAVRDWAQAAEALGYSHVIVYDHVLGAVHAGREPVLLGPYTERDPFHEPFVLLAYLAALTEHLELTTGVLILPQRQTALVAKQAIELDLLSRGRLRLGVGTGDIAVAVGAQPATVNAWARATRRPTGAKRERLLELVSVVDRLEPGMVADGGEEVGGLNTSNDVGERLAPGPGRAKAARVDVIFRRATCPTHRRRGACPQNF